MDSKGRITAADIPDDAMLRAVDALQSPPKDGYRSWVMLGDLCRIMDGYPWKVVLAKFRQLHKRGLLDGCPCGCRGDIQITARGMDVIEPGVDHSWLQTV